MVVPRSCESAMYLKGQRKSLHLLFNSRPELTKQCELQKVYRFPICLTHTQHTLALAIKKLLQNTNLRFAASFSNVGILTVSEKDHYKLGFGLLKAYGSADWM